VGRADHLRDEVTPGHRSSCQAGIPMQLNTGRVLHLGAGCRTVGLLFLLLCGIPRCQGMVFPSKTKSFDHCRVQGTCKKYAEQDCLLQPRTCLNQFAREDSLGLLAADSKHSHCTAERKTGGFAGSGNCRIELVLSLVFLFSLQPAMNCFTKIQRNLGPSPPERAQHEVDRAATNPIGIILCRCMFTQDCTHLLSPAQQQC
jgi:hypothetical protein